MPDDASCAPPTRSLALRLLALAWRYRGDCLKTLLVQILLLGLAISGLSLGGLGIDFLRYCVDAGAPAPRWPGGWSPPAAWSPRTVLAAIGGGVLILALFRAGLEFLVADLTARLVQGRIVVDLRTQVYDQLQRLSFRFFDANASSSLINRVTRDVQSTRMFIDTVMLQGVVMSLSLAVCFTYMITLHAPLTAACLASMPLLGWLCLRHARRMRPRYEENRQLMDRLVASLAETFQGIRVIKGFAREPETAARFAVANREVQMQQNEIFDRTSLYVSLLNFLTQFNQVILLSYGGYLVMTDRLPLGAGLIVFSGLLQQFSSQVAGLGNLANSLEDSFAAARRVFEVLDTPVEIRSLEAARPLPRATPCAIEFRNVTFGYAPEQPVLKELSLNIRAGEYVALLGATGSGKSTLFSLIPRFYDPQAGQVLVNGQDVRELELGDLRRNIGVVFQENFLFSTRVRDNIAFGEPHASAAAIERASRLAAAHEFVAALPEGYETALGEGGSGLSGGQRQRLGIARALLLDPGILLLDDPTAALDAETEREVLAAMEQARQGRTTLIVAHRLSTLQRADRIVLLQGGRIVQAGRHEELMAQKGPYRWLVSSQLVDRESRRLLDAGSAARGEAAEGNQ